MGIVSLQFPTARLPGSHRSGDAERHRSSRQASRSAVPHRIVTGKKVASNRPVMLPLDELLAD